MRTERGFCAHRGFSTVSFSSISGGKTNVILFRERLTGGITLTSSYLYYISQLKIVNNYGLFVLKIFHFFYMIIS